MGISPSHAARLRPPRPPIHVAVLRTSALVGYFRSMAMAIEILHGTRSHWKEYRESTLLNFAYAMMPWKVGPGTMEVDQDWRLIEARTQILTANMLEKFFKKLESGPQTAYDYCVSQNALRMSATLAVRELLNASIQVNNDVAQKAEDGARNMARLQFACTLILAGTGCWLAMGGAVPALLATTHVGLKATAVGLSYNVAGTLIKDGKSWGSAQAIAIEGSKSGGGEWLGTAEKSAQTRLAETIATKSQQIAATEVNINRLNAEIARKTSRKKIIKLTAQRAAKQAGIDRARQEIGKATVHSARWTVASKAVPLLFLAHDVYQAWDDLQKAEEKLR